MAKKRSSAKQKTEQMTPYLTVTNAAAAIEFYKSAFDASEVVRHTVPGTDLIEYAELKICGSSIIVCDEFPELGIWSPLSTGRTSSMLDLRVKETEALWLSALGAGATEIVAMRNVPWGGASGKLVDPFGHYWAISGEAIEVEAEVEAEFVVPVPCASEEAIVAAA